MDHYTLDQIPHYRRQFIDARLSKFLRDFSIKKWPLDCVDLIKNIRDDKRIPLQIGVAANVRDKFDAVSRYVEEENVYQIILNRNKVRYPFQNSRDRRLNFTIGHELGHIILDHLYIPDTLKNDEERHIEDLEANEFAGKLLMPKKILLSCNFVSFPAVAEYFNVSTTALWMRLNNLQRLDLLSSRKSKVCNVCGNTQMHYVAKFCCICGNKLENNLNGIERTHYFDGVKLDRYQEACECPYCGDSSGYWFNGVCSKCNTMLYNYCHKGLYVDKGGCIYENPGNARFCEMCGSPTYFFSMGFLKPWEEARSLMLANAVAEGSMEYSF